MNESVGYTVTINIIITFIVIVFIFIANALINYKSNRVGNIITSSIEKYNGFNSYSEAEIDRKLDTIGYNKMKISCEDVSGCVLQESKINEDIETAKKGYCVYFCDAGSDYYYYKVKANMVINIPIINDIVTGKVFSSTKNMYNFNGKLTPVELNPSYQVRS